jgi:hypothetical protein
VVRSQSTLQRLLRRQIKKKTRFIDISILFFQEKMFAMFITITMQMHSLLNSGLCHVLMYEVQKHYAKPPLPTVQFPWYLLRCL